jgi:hypothetical protein
MAKLVVGLFDSIAEARQAAEDLVRSGLAREAVSLVAGDMVAFGQERSRALGRGGAEEARTLTIPGIGPVVVSGLVAAALRSARTGALAERLVEAGVPLEDAEIYHEGVRRGGALVLTHTSAAQAQAAAAVIAARGPADLEQCRAEMRASGWSGRRANERPYTAPEIQAFRARRSAAVAQQSAAAAPDAPPAPLRTYDDYQPLFRAHYDAVLSRSGYTYEQCRPVFHYGYTLGRDRRYSQGEWAGVEPEARRHWEERNPGTWDSFKESVRYAWEQARKQGSEPQA